MTETTKGFLAIIGANVIWGLSPLYYKLLQDVPALEVLAHRTAWSLVFFAALLAVQQRIGALIAVLRMRDLRWPMIFGAMFISFNWGLWIWSVQTGQTVEAALGYYIFPLISVSVGILVFREGTSRGKLVALALATLGVTILGAGLGALPWVAIALATSFTAYGVIKKRAKSAPTLSVTAEVVVIFPISLLALTAFHTSSAGGQFGVTWHTDVLLALTGPMTALPLVLFSYGSRRLSFATLGLLFYVNPSLQFFVATLVFKEPVTIWHMIALPLIWMALAIYTGSLFSAERAARRDATSSVTE